MEELLARIEAATGAADPQLVADIYKALGDQALDRGKLGWTWRQGGRGVWNNLPDLLNSLDAALALKDRVLPGFAAAVGDMAFEGTSRTPWACIWTPAGEPKHTAEGATPPLALLAALLKALSHQPPRAPDEPGDRAREAGKFRSIPDGDA